MASLKFDNTGMKAIHRLGSAFHPYHIFLRALM